MKAYYACFLEESEQFSVFFPDLLGCHSCGKTIKEAYTMASEALAGHLQSMYDDHDDIPKSSSYIEALQKIKEYFHELEISYSENLILQLIPAPELQEKAVKVTVSFKKTALELIDHKAEKYGFTRSGFLAKAAKAYHGHETR